MDYLVYLNRWELVLIWAILERVVELNFQLHIKYLLDKIPFLKISFYFKDKKTILKGSIYEENIPTTQYSKKENSRI